MSFVIPTTGYDLFAADDILEVRASPSSYSKYD